MTTVMSTQLQLVMQAERIAVSSLSPPLLSPSRSLLHSLVLGRLTRSRARARVSLHFSTSELYLGELWYYPTD